MESGWKDEVNSAYQNWKYNQIHKDIKEYFKNPQNRMAEPFKRESEPLIANLSELKEEVEEKRRTEERVFFKDTEKKINFLGSKIEVADADDDEVDEYCKDTIFGGFWKTITKLCNVVYLSLKSVGSVLKKLLKKLVDFLEAGMKKALLAIGKR